MHAIRFAVLFLLVSTLFGCFRVQKNKAEQDSVQGDRASRVQGSVPASEVKSELDKLEGVWEVKTFTKLGVEATDWVKDNSPKLTFDGENYTWKAGNGSEDGKFKFGSEGSLRTIDFSITSGNDKGKFQLGIYEVDGDDLKLCFAAPGTADRPMKFASKANGAEYILSTLKRQSGR